MSSNNKIVNRRGILLGKVGLLLFLLNLLSTGLFAQSIVIKGTVKDDVSRETLEGAAIQQVGTKNGTIADKDGRFTISVPAESKLYIQFFGFKSEIVQLKPGQTTLEVRLKKSIISLNEVTVNTGLYKRPAGNFTGSAKTYSGEELKTLNPRSAIHALASIDPAVRLTENNAMGSNPNQLPVIQIRGQNNLPTSLNGGATANAVTEGDIMSSYLSNPNEPLIILDGFQTTMRTIYDMDINLIASITVLKDAAATVAYGSKAANGVIVVESKQPTPGKLRVTYSINTNIEVPDLTSYNLMNAEQLLEAQRLSGMYSSANQASDIALKQWYDYRLSNVKRGVNSYWLSQPVQIGYGTSHSLSMSGGSGALRYSFSANYNNNEGVMKESSRNRYGLGYSVAYISKNIRLDNRTSLSYVKANSTPWGSYNDYAKQFPYFRTKDEDGNLIKIFEPNSTELGFGTGAPGGTFTNPAYNSTLNLKLYSTPLSITNNTNVEWTISDDFRVKGSFGWSGNSLESETFLPANHTKFVGALDGMAGLGSYDQLRGSNSAMDGRISANYNKRFGRHTILTSLGASITKTSSTSTLVSVTGIPNDYLGELGMANGYYYTNTKPNAQKAMTRGLSNYLSLSYNYADRYTAEFTVNQSGSSQFGSNNRMAPFYGGGIAWSIDKEKFFKQNDIIQTAKLRASIGITGNQNFPPSMAQQVYAYNFNNNYRLQMGGTTSMYANPDLQWQQTLKENVGLTLGFFKGKLNASVEVFRETTNNLILPLDVAPSTGFINYQNNLGGTRSQGYEIGVSAPIIKNSSKNIFWNINVNAGHYSNVLTKLSPAVEAINKANNILKPNGKEQLTPLPRYVLGQSMSRIWAVPSLGIDPATGKEVFVKLDGSHTFTWDPNDKRPIADATSKLKGAFSSNLNYKNFAFSFSLGYQFGGYQYNQTLVDKVENVDLAHGNADVRVLTDRWKKPGDISSFKSLVADGNFSTMQFTSSTSRFVTKNNFIEASSVTVGYNFPSTLKWIKAAHLSAPRLSITQNNVARFATIKAERGTGYPFARSFSFGLSTNF